MAEKENCKRAVNFSPKEQNILMTIVKKYAKQIESRKSDTNNLKIKTKAWEQVCKDFNMISGDQYRDLKSLKNKYENLKKRSKQKVADEKRYFYGTGGGPSKDFTPILDSLNDTIKEIIGSQMTGLTSEFYDDQVEEILIVDDANVNMVIEEMIPMEDSHTILISPDEHEKNISAFPGVPLPQLDDDINTGNGPKDWKKYAPDMLRTPVSTQLKINQKLNETSSKPSTSRKSENLKTKIGIWASSKQNFVEAQEDCFKKEHLIKIKQMEHSLQHNQEKHDQHLQHQKEEHALKIEILELQKQKLLLENSL